MSVDPNRRGGHAKKQSWWKKNSRSTVKRNRTFKSSPPTSSAGHSTDTSDADTNASIKSGHQATTEPLRIPPDSANGSTKPGKQEQGSSEINILTADSNTLTPRQIRNLQQQLSSALKLKRQLEMELNLRASQVEQMEDNLRLVADQSKMIGVRAMEQEQKLLEVKTALELKTKQLALYRSSKADQLPLNEITVLPMHLRGKFSEFLRHVLVQQKAFFEKALRDFVEQRVTDRELSYHNPSGQTPGKAAEMSRQSLLSEIGKIGNSLAFDYMSELELRLNGTFSAQSQNYTLHKHGAHGGGGVHGQNNTSRSFELGTPSMSQQHATSPGYAQTSMTLQPHNSLGSRVSGHTPQHSGSVGPMGSLTPQTSTGDVGNAASQSGSKKVKTGGAFDKARKLLRRKPKEEDKQSPTMQVQQPPPSRTTTPQPQYPPANYAQYGQPQPQAQQFGPHQYNTGVNMNMNSMGMFSQTHAQAQNAYSFHRSVTSMHKSESNVAHAADMDQLMDELAKAEEENSRSSRSGSVIIKDEEMDTLDQTDPDYDSANDNDGDADGDGDGQEVMNIEQLKAMGMREDSENDRGMHELQEDDDDEDDDGQEDQFDGDALAMQQHLMSMTKQHTQAIIATHGPDGGEELNKMWSQFVQFKKEMDRPSDAPLAFTVPDKATPFVELRDMMEALPFDLASAILREQQLNPYDRIKDVTLQRGCWPQVRFVKQNRVATVNKVFVRFDDALRRLEMYLQNEKESGEAQQLSAAHLAMMNPEAGDDVKTQIAPKPKPAGRQLLGALDPQKTTGFRLHQITSIVRQRNEARDTITAINLRVGRLWNMESSMEATDNLISDALDFYQSLDTPSTMLLLGPNTSEKCALCREITRQLSSSPISARTALVDTRSTVGGFTKSPIETGQAIRFYVNSIENQKNQIAATRSIYPQVVVVDEVLSIGDIESIGKLQSEGISVVVGTNMHSLEALLGHPVYSQLLPPQNRLVTGYSDLNTLSGGLGGHGHGHSRRSSYQYSAMSPHLLILEINADGTEVKMFKNIPEAVKAIKRFSQPDFKTYKLKWQGYNPTDASSASKYMNNQMHRRTTSRMVRGLMKDTLQHTSVSSSRGLLRPVSQYSMHEAEESRSMRM